MSESATPDPRPCEECEEAHASIDESVLASEGWAARARGDLAASETIATNLRARFPDAASGFQMGLMLAREARRFDDWSRLMQEADAHFGSQSWLLTEAGWAERSKGNSARTAEIAAILRQRFPELATGYQMGALAARDLGEFEAAKQIVAEASGRFPDDFWLLEDAGWEARSLGDSVRARVVAEQMRARAPGVAVGYQIGIAAARDLRLLDEADRIGVAARERFSGAAWPLEETARTAWARPDLAVVKWAAAELRQKFPDNPTGYQLGFDAAIATDETDDAARIATRMIRRFPAESWASQRAALVGVDVDAPEATPTLDIPESENFVAYLKNRDTLLVWFGGINEPFFSAEFARTNAYDCLYFRDGAYDWYTNGVRGVFASASALRDWLANFRARYAYSVVCGQSSGGHAALYYGKICRFDLCIAFSPQIHNTFDGHCRMAPLVRIPDLRELYADGARNPRVVLNVGRSESDHAHEFEWKDLEQIKEFKLNDGVTLITHPYDTHAVSVAMRRRGELYRFIACMIDLHRPANAGLAAPEIGLDHPPAETDTAPNTDTAPG